MTPIDFQGQGSKVKVTNYTLLLNLVNMIQTKLLNLGLSNLVLILLMTRLNSSILTPFRKRNKINFIAYTIAVIGKARGPAPYSH